ncbi:MAG: HIT zinc finger family protein [Amphiamblys sp. WSBS2006]|nr:MAG: HIT zinc finger family protein [Amphiamblys sp. WSBS2006]
MGPKHQTVKADTGPDTAASHCTQTCRVCGEDQAVYKCPACRTETCSLGCSKRHLLESVCSGKRKIDRNTPLKEYSTGNYFRELEFLARGRSFGRENTGQREDRSLARVCAERGIKLERMPQGMSKTLANRTSVEGDTVRWSVDVVAVAQGKMEHLDGVGENRRISEIVSEAFPGPERCAVYLYDAVGLREAAYDTEDTWHVDGVFCRRVSPNAVFGEALRSVTIAEYPSLYVVPLPELQKYVQ